jgi:hypothetical protein
MACVDIPQMEFPEDILGHIKGYSKPIMQYSTEYVRCKKALKEAMQGDDWPTLKKRLCDKDADKVIQAYIAYSDARIATWNIRQEQSRSSRWMYHNPTEEQKIRDKEVREEIGVCVHNTCLTMKAFFEVLYTKEEREAYKKYMDEMYLNDE